MNVIVPADYAAILAQYTHEGYRVLACGYRPWSKWGAADPHKQRFLIMDYFDHLLMI